ncbi:MAG: phage/plasmid replication protein, II/X family [Actinomycetota bacterium]|nr:phage/plasmid replication protein, II/X family [Actinomycetota bacterium]
MIDWLTFVAPLAHVGGEKGPFYAGEVMATKPDPTHPDGFALDWSIWKRKSFEGSYSNVIQIQSTTDELCRPAIWVSGNPAKWFQGHNVFGTADIRGLVLEMLHRICRSVGVTPSPEDLSLWHAGIIKLSRVDITHSFDLGTLPRVRNALRSLDSTANLKHRGRGHFRGDSLLFGKGSRRWSLTLYAKGAELNVKGHALPLDLADSSVAKIAQGLLRAEVRMQSLQLVAEHLEYLAYWGENAGSELHSRFLSGLQIAEASMLDAETLDGLPGRLQLAYNNWREGHDLRAILSRPTFYRYRLELLKRGIDIAVKQKRTSPDLSNVIPLRTVLHAYPMTVPDWAVGTPLYFEPRAKVA